MKRRKEGRSRNVEGRKEGMKGEEANEKRRG